MSGTPKSFGRSDLMAIAAVRYCLGRISYIVGDCCDWLVWQWENIDESARNTIRRDVEDAFKRDDQARERDEKYRPLGMDCDRHEWERVRRLWRTDNA